MRSVDDTGKVMWDTPQCAGKKGYADLALGASVTVRDQSGSIVATGSVDETEWGEPWTEHFDGVEGTPAEDYGYGLTTEAWEGIPGWTSTYALCNLKFTVADVPQADFYTVELAHRGEVPVSRADLDSQDWHMALSLGGKRPKAGRHGLEREVHRRFVAVWSPASDRFARIGHQDPSATARKWTGRIGRRC